jgi:hypothetical protein
MCNRISNQKICTHTAESAFSKMNIQSEGFKHTHTLKSKHTCVTDSAIKKSVHIQQNQHSTK